MQSILWTLTLYGLLWSTGKNHNDDSTYVDASYIDPSSSSNSYSNHHSGISTNDFIYRQSYQLDLSSTPVPVSFPRNTTDLQTDKSCHVSTGKSTKASFDTWIQKFNSQFEKINFIDIINNDDDDTDDDDDSDDQDQDNDDGHSSMLSMLSLRRKQLQQRQSSSSSSSSLRFVTTTFRSNDDKNSIHHRRKRHSKVTLSSVVTSAIQKHRPSESIFRVGRGGSSMSDGTTMIPNDSPTRMLSQWLLAAYQSQVGRNLIVSAIVTLVFEAMIGHILEFLKIVMQTSSSSNTDISYVQVVRSITAEKGILGLWDGFCPWGIVQAVCKGAVFGLAHATALQTLKPLAEQKYIPMALALTLAGGIGGGFQGYILSPTLLLKTRVMTVRLF